MLDLYKTLKPRDTIIKEKLEEIWSKLESDYLTNHLETIKNLVLTDCQIIKDSKDIPLDDYELDEAFVLQPD